MSKATKSSVLEAWSKSSGRKDQYDLREVESFDGVKQLQLVDKDTGSVSIAVNGTGDDALQRLEDNVGALLLDAAVNPKESSSVESKEQFTSRGNLASPSQPVAVVDPSEPVVVNMQSSEAPQSGDVPTAVNPVTGGSTVASGKTSGSATPEGK